jgi:hypothetical protein
LEEGDRLLPPAQVVEHATGLYRGRGDAELIARLLGQGAGLFDEAQRALEVVSVLVIDRKARECANASPTIIGLRDREGAPPDRLRLLEALPRPWHPAGEQKRPRDRPRLVEPLGCRERSSE